MTHTRSVRSSDDSVGAPDSVKCQTILPFPKSDRNAYVTPAGDPPERVLPRSREAREGLLAKLD
jgi:hypothetical protein